MSGIEKWYAVADNDPRMECRFHLTSTSGVEFDDDDWACQAAHDYFKEHDGYENRWPIVIVLFDVEDGEEVVRYSVDREAEPHFYPTVMTP